MHPQIQVNLESLEDPVTFWKPHADNISWFKKPSSVLSQHTRRLPSGASHSSWQWFPDGELNTCYNCVDRHVKAGRGGEKAIFWHSEVAGERRTIDYAELKSEVQTLAGVLQDNGVGKVPMIPQALFAMLACARLGAIHAVVFGGFGAHALAQRLDSCKPTIVLTASCGIEGPRKKIDYQPLIRGAIRMCKSKPRSIIVYQRSELRWTGGVDSNQRELDWEECVIEARRRSLQPECAVLRTEDPLYIIYTSGTTGAPKGVLRQNGGHAVGLQLSMRATAGIHGPGDVVLGVSDIGWVTGHSYVLYGPLLSGAATVLFEGKPVGTPDAGIVWHLVEQYRVNTIFTAPTALRAIRRADPELKLLHDVGKREGLRSLRALWLTGERSQPGLIDAFQKLLLQYAAPGALMIDNWGLSEQGVPLSSTDIVPRSSVDASWSIYESKAPLRTPPGCAGRAMPGMGIHCVDDDGNEVSAGTMGNMVLSLPLSPSSFTTLWQDDARFYSSYLKRFDGKWFDTGDAGCMTEEGYVQIWSRSDDVINVAGHRLSTGAIEQAISAHPAVAECCVVGIPDELKGHLPLGFITTYSSQDENELFREVQKLVREQQGSIASLGGIISAKQGENLVPKTRSGKMLRRTLRELIENSNNSDWEKEVQVPATIEDASAINIARAAINAYFTKKLQQSGKPKL